MTEQWAVRSQQQQSEATMNGQSESSDWYLYYFTTIVPHDMLATGESLSFPRPPARAEEVGYYVWLLLVIVKLEDIIINGKTALKMVIVKTQ